MIYPRAQRFSKLTKLTNVFSGHLVVLTKTGKLQCRRFPRDTPLEVAPPPVWTFLPSVIHGTRISLLVIPSVAGDPSLPQHPFASTTSQLEILPNKIDIEEEARRYEEACWEGDRDSDRVYGRPSSPTIAPSIFSGDGIWLGDNSGESSTFARDVKISGWTSVGDNSKGGAYIVYDCVIKTKEGTVIHAHKRYNAFVDLENSLRKTLPRHQQRYIPQLPPKAPLARYRPAFLDRRRRQLEYWLSSVLLHPDVGGCKAVRLWVMD
ncbi:hypothetical protein D9758_016391 [Tetrapyrgos nigripes]|uniref:Endosomal/vacuolar adapter protein YPT35 n=1 Tax=Tetrapyrgos nigripes TaxID=182062 RepID=A0A8H5C8A3_9AGAR|nr:hypothetical protein D9758_016391 [Tetrapyrgos nigripes]